MKYNPRSKIQWAWLILTLCGLVPPHTSVAQTDIPLGTWRAHLSYNAIRWVEIGPEKVYAAGNSGVLIYDRNEQSIVTYNKLNGLSSTGISGIALDNVRQQLLVGYTDGTLDIIGENTVYPFTRLRDAGVTTSKMIRHISLRESLAYLSTAYGVVVFDLNQQEIKETWRDLGPSGQRLSVFQTAFLDDSIFVATDNGVIAGHLSDNLLDFNNWTRFNNGSLAGPIPAIVSFNNKIYAAGAESVLRFTGDAWIQESFPVTAIESLAASEQNLFVISGSVILTMNTSGEMSSITDAKVIAPSGVKQDADGTLWIADELGGLVSNLAGNFTSFIPNGPSFNNTHQLVYHNEKITMVGGGFSTSGQPLKIAGDLNVFENGSWTTETLPVFDLTDVAFTEGKTYLASFGSGLLAVDASGEITYHNETNSPLVHSESGQSRVTALAPSTHGLWVANFGGSESLHLLKADDSWESFPLNFPNAQYPVKMATDQEGQVWIALNPTTGGGLLIFDPEEKQALQKTTAIGSGALPHHVVFSLASDRDGNMWVGTTAGLAYFFSPAEDAIKPIYENRFLLRDEKITAIAVDGGNRKWIGTEQGAWLFNPSGEELIHHFTEENSPLLSNIIRDIVIDPETGEVFFATDQGIISYRSDAVDAGAHFEDIKIFPNPVRPGYSGTVGISGLASDARVRITDISGKLVWQTQANGGMATWHVRDHQGTRVTTGIYLVFASSADGSESMVGKVAVVE